MKKNVCKNEEDGRWKIEDRINVDIGKLINIFSFKDFRLILMYATLKN